MAKAAVIYHKTMAAFANSLRSSNEAEIRLPL